MTTLEQVADWHTKFLVPSPSTPTFQAPNVDLRIALIDEERDELFQALADRNSVEQLDALCDLQYVLDGAIISLGMTETVRLMNGGKPFVYHSPMIDGTIAVSARVWLLTIKTKHLGVSLKSGDVPGVAIIFCDMQSILTSLVEAMGFKDVFAAAFEKVNENNLAKLWSQEEVNAWVMNRCFSDESYKQLRFTPATWEDGFIANDLSGKVRKPIAHPKVDLSEFVR